MINVNVNNLTKKQTMVLVKLISWLPKTRRKELYQRWVDLLTPQQFMLNPHLHSLFSKYGVYTDLK